MSVRLILTMLKLALEDGPSVYGGVLNALNAIYHLIDSHGAAGVTLGQIDSVLREYNVRVDEIAETYSREWHTSP